MKKTAIDFFKEELEIQLDFKAVEKFWGGLYDEAQEMFKQQIIDTFVDVNRANCEHRNIKLRLKDIIDFKNIGEVYYNETFKQNQNV